MKPTIAFLGTGLMGEPMCHNLLEAGLPLTVWNRSKDKTKRLAKRLVLSLLRFQTVNGNPASSRLWHIGSPMSPVPRKAMVGFIFFLRHYSSGWALASWLSFAFAKR